MHGPINVKSPNNTSSWQMGFNSAFKGLITLFIVAAKPVCSVSNSVTNNRCLWCSRHKQVITYRVLNPVARIQYKNNCQQMHIKLDFCSLNFSMRLFLQLCIYISCNLLNVLVLKGICFFCLQRMLAHCSATLSRYVADGLKVNSPVDSSGVLHRHANPLAWQSQKLPLIQTRLHTLPNLLAWHTGTDVLVYIWTSKLQ
jgi:hypothetical protein